MTRRAGRTIVTAVVTWAGAVIALYATRPGRAGYPTSWSGDDVARVAGWTLAAASTGWLTATTFMYWIALALVRLGATSAHRTLRWAPPVARRFWRAALAGTLAVGQPPPVTLHVGPDGRLPRGHERPVRRAPTTTTPVTKPAIRPSAPSRARPPRARGPRRHRVEVGDNLWTIARSELARRAGRAPDDRDIAPYWLRVIAENRATLRSGDPSLIYPGEIVTLPNP